MTRAPCLDTRKTPLAADARPSAAASAESHGPAERRGGARRLPPRSALLSLSLLAVAAGARSEEKIEPDRRDFTIGTGIVAPGKVQVEAGVLWERSSGERQWTIGDATLRMPVTPAFEVHLGLPSYVVRRSTERASGFDDVPIEARWRVYRSEGVDLAVQTMAMLPTGSRQVAERNLQPGAVLAASLKLHPAVGLVLDLGGRRASNDGQRFGQAFAAASIRVDLSERWNVFAETYAFNREERGGDSRRYAAAGAVLFIDRDTAIDARVGSGVRNGDAAPALASVGVSRRF